MKNITQYLRSRKQEPLYISLLETTYTVAPSPPAIVGICVAALESDGNLSQTERITLIRQAIEAIFGAGAFDTLIPHLPADELTLLLYYALSGYNDDLLASWDQQSTTPASAEGNAPDSAGETSASIGDSSAPISDANTALTSTATSTP